ncbi:MAG: peptidoglycan DD-metalloendopeptidase family protein [Gemmatimonadales bacterium]
MRDARMIAAGWLLLASGLAAQAPPVTVRALPAEPLIERDADGQRLNFDFSLENGGTTPLELERIDLSVFDRADRLVHRQFIWAKGAASPGLLTIPERTIPTGGSLSVFNPFYHLPGHLDLARLRYDFVFETRGIAPTRSVGIDVAPKPAETVPLVLPIDGPAIVYDGHDYYSHHRRIPIGGELAKRIGISMNPVRYANDFAPVGPRGELSRGSLADPTSWYAYGALVRAPAAGVVVSAAGDVPDNRIEGGELIVPNEVASDPIKSALGNHLVIRHGPRSYSVLAHLRAGTVGPAVGDSVRQGERVAEIGFSGDTGFHVHVHQMLVTEAKLDTEGLPSYFDGVRRVALPLRPGGATGPVLNRVRLDTGDLVQSAR